MRRPVRIGNVSGLYGDRPDGMRSMLDGGAIDILTGDWLAELTMLILARTKARQPDGGYGRTLLPQLEDTMADILDRGVRVVVNAGGLDPIGCATAIRDLGSKLGLTPSVAAISGDNLLDRVNELQAAGEQLRNTDTGALPGPVSFVVANAYMGGWGIAKALDEGADIVVTGRVTDAALVVGAAAWWHGWDRHDWDPLAGAVVAGHVIECSMQATGGNYSSFTELPNETLPGFPWAEIAADGSSIIGKHDETGGEVSVGTVTSQLLYEIGGPEYHNADVTARFDSIGIEQIGPDRVALTGIKGQPPPQTLKVGAARPGGYRNSMMIGITGLDAEAKAGTLLSHFWQQCPWDESDYDEVRTTWIGRGESDPSSNAAAISYLEIAVRDTDEQKAGRRWADSLVQIALGSIPGVFAAWPPRKASPFAVFWPTTVDRRHVHQHVQLNDGEWIVPETDPGQPFVATVEPVAVEENAAEGADVGPLGSVVDARSGDKGGSANLGVFVRDETLYPWLADFLTIAELRRLLPELAELEIERYEFPRLRALNFVIEGILDEGVSSTLRVDPQAKGLGEYLRAKHVPLPEQED